MISVKSTFQFIFELRIWFIFDFLFKHLYVHDFYELINEAFELYRISPIRFAAVIKYANGRSWRDRSSVSTSM